MKEWWESLQSRERRTLSMGGIALGLIVLYFGIWEPFANTVSTLHKSVDDQRAVMTWMQQSADEVRRLRGSGAAGTVVRDGRSLLALVDQTAKSAGLGGSLKRVEPEGSDGVRVWLDQVGFDDMMRWLSGLAARNGVTVSSVNIDRQETPGQVNARLTLQGQGQ